MNWNWITSTPDAPLMIFISAFGVYVFLIICVRFIGLRSFSKMSSFDFAITVAMGSLVASTLINEKPPLLDGILGLLALFVIQYGISFLRRRTNFMGKLVDNRPILLMAGSTILKENLDTARITMGDINSHLRRSGITHPDQVLAVVLETTGDISVLQVNDKEGKKPVAKLLFDDVRGAELLEEYYV